MSEELIARVTAWRDGDPDQDARGELDALLAAGDFGELSERFAGSLAFGTAGLRGVVAAGPNRMNRAVVIRTTRGLVDYLLQTDEALARDRGVVLAYDARLDSDQFAQDVTDVFLAAGIPVHVFEDAAATPLGAYAARVLGAAAAVIVTASHNPPEYNGYKVYADDAAQIVPPTDGAIAAAIDAVGPANAVPMSPPAAERHLLGADMITAYFDELMAERRAVDLDQSLTVVHTPLHGVGGEPVRQLLELAGYEDLYQVAEQVEPDGRFPTVAFPNPEEPGALDLAVALAKEVEADLVIANDPDVDRLAAALPDPLRPDRWKLLTGNQIGALLGAYVLDGAGERSIANPLVGSSIVSSPMLTDIAEARGADHASTLTGFKWICRAAKRLAEQGHNFVYGFEEAIGYTVGGVVRDKDGIGAALALVDFAAMERAAGRTLTDALADLYREHGLWSSGQVSITMPGSEGAAQIAAAMTRIDADQRPGALDGFTVVGATDYRVGADERPEWLPASDLVELFLGGGSRVLVRPSGTEPKLKIYVDLRMDLAEDDDVWIAEAALRERCGKVGEAMAAWLGLRD